MTHEQLRVFARPRLESMMQTQDMDELDDEQASDAALFSQGFNMEEVIVKRNAGFVIPSGYEGWVGAGLPFESGPSEIDEGRHLKAGTYFWDGCKLWRVRRAALGGIPRLRVVFRGESNDE